MDAPIVLAHSAAGLLLPAVAGALGAVHQIWLAAVVADHAGGRSLRAEVGDGPEVLFHQDWIGVDPTRDPDLARHFLFHDAADDELAQGLATLALTSFPSVVEEVTPVDPRAVGSTYLLPRHDRTLRPEWMARAARERLGVEPVEIDGGHNPYCANPAAIADEIAAVTRSRRPGS